MKIRLLILAVLGIWLQGETVLGQSRATCSHCKMAIEDDQFRARAELASGETYRYDAVECMVNQLKTGFDGEIASLTVTDYPSGDPIDAREAVYLKSPAIRSPMGANLSAYAGRAAALEMQRNHGGELLSWVELQARFADSQYGQAGHEHHHGGVASKAPASIMGDHVHPAGSFMVSLRYMTMAMEDLRNGDSRVSGSSALEDFMMAPREMTMQMYMLGAMYGVTNRLTLTAMQPYVLQDMVMTAQMSMDGGMPMQQQFATQSSGLGDLKVGILYTLARTHNSGLHLNAGLGVPLGRIDSRANTPMMSNAPLPYAMQPGSGTWDFRLGATYTKSYTQFSWGLQQMNTLRTGTNSRGYRLGNRYEVHAWGGYAVLENLGLNVRLSGLSEASIRGQDTELNPMMSPATQTSNYGGTRLSGGLGLNYLTGIDGLVLAVELDNPLYQKTNGTFLEQDLSVFATARYNL